MDRNKIYELINNERDFQDNKFPEDVENWHTAHPAVKYVVLGEEYGEVGRAILEKDRINLVEELVQVAALAVKWLEFLGPEEYENF